MGRFKVTSCCILIFVELIGFNFLVSCVSPDEFISIDCGGSNSTDPQTNLPWKTDLSYLQDFQQLLDENIIASANVTLQTGETPVDNEKQLETARVFYPGGPDDNRIPRSKYCYRLPVNITENETEAPRSYLLRATFPSRNLTAAVDGRALNGLFSTRFYFSVDSTYVATIELYEDLPQFIELIIDPLSNNRQENIDADVPSNSSVVYVCLVPLEDRSSMPAISALELRPFDAGMYIRSYERLTSGPPGRKSQQGSYLMLMNRTNFGGNLSLPSVRYPNDPYDRIWSAPKINDSMIPEFSLKRDARIPNSTTETVPNDNPYWPQDYEYPQEVFATAWVGEDKATKLSFTFNLSEPRAQNPTPTFYTSILFHGIKNSSENTSKGPVIDVYYNPGNGLQELYPNLTLSFDLKDRNSFCTIFGERLTVMSDNLTFTIQANNQSEFPATVSGVELYGEFYPVITRTFSTDGNKLFGELPAFTPYSVHTKALHTMEYLSLASNQFNGSLSSLMAALDIPLYYLNLSSNSFAGDIPLELGNLTNLKILDMSNNRLSGKLDVNLSGLQHLQDLDLNNNNFTTLNLTTWFSAITKAKNLDAVNQKVRLINNTIESVFLPSLDFPSDVIPLRGESFILLGDNNPWCKGNKSADKTLLLRYLCRSNETQDFWVPPGDSGSSKTTLIAVGVTCAVLLLIMSCVLIFFLRRMLRRVRELHEIQEALAKEGVKPPFFKYDDLKTATRSFSLSNVLGAGGFGTVYKAELQDGSTLAVKKLVPTEQNMSDFLREMVNITGIKHRNLIQLKGCCVGEKQRRMLVYEYAENRNLAEALWGPQKPFVLNWQQRFGICLGIARGICYLHEELNPKMVHRDIKPQNILLDKDYNAKIADFGLVRPSSTDNTQITFNIGGTKGYCSPEYISEGLVSEKLDVYSFGIVLLEIVSGRMCVDYELPKEQIFLRNWALELYEGKKLLNLVDEKLMGEYNEEEVLLVLHTALACCRLDWRERPTMGQVVSKFMKHEDVVLDIARVLKGDCLKFEDLLEEDILDESDLSTTQRDANQAKRLLSGTSTSVPNGSALEHSVMRPR
ncbi:hypothetical protein R1flu_002473 [Riccia fluitans]|uniref:non-specific serine/threonine protein kinase n=1 Tax=Riccia fluitans TaxID=41844 RepID=A0ABD1Y670_9MARC